MSEELEVVEMGDAGEETRQSVVVGTVWDNIFGKSWN